MTRRPSLAPACLLTGSLGLVLGLSDLHRMLSGLLGQNHDLLFEPGLPKPHGIGWAAGLRGTDSLLSSLDTPLRALALVLLLGVLAMLGGLLNPSFRLLKPPAENVGKGAGAHLEPAQLGRAALATLVCLWLLGALAPLAYLVPQRSPALLPLVVLLSGVAAWVFPAGNLGAPLVQSLVLIPLVWLVWGPGGITSPVGHKDNEGDGKADGKGDKKGNRGRTLLWGLLGGGAAAPAVLGLFAGRAWIAEAAPAFSLLDPAGWRLVMLLCVAVPTAAALALVPVAVWFRPPVEEPRPVGRAAAASLAVLLLTGMGAVAALGELRRLDVGVPGLRRLLGLTTPALPRIAVVLGPRGETIPSTTADGSDDAQGGDSIAVNTISRPAAAQFLTRQKYRSRLIQRAFEHLFVCDSLDWLTTEQLELCLQMLEHAPSPRAARYLLEKLSDCPSTPANLRALDALADPARFDWPDRRRWLGFAYLRFGETARAREFLLHAGLSQPDLRRALGGLSPLADGKIRGRVLFGGMPRGAVRVGLMRADIETLKLVAGFCRPMDWRCVSASAYSRPDGAFELGDLPEGRYVLILTSGDMGRSMGRVAIFQGPGAIELDRVHPERTLPPFDVELARPMRPPVRARPGVTA